METIQHKVKGALIKGFPRAKVPRMEGGRSGVLAVVVSSRFRGLKTERRLKLIDQTLSAALTEKEFAKIALIVPMTPEEAEARPDLVYPNGSQSNPA